MICSSCNSANPEDVRFCLQCGHWLQEIDDDVTHVRSPRVQPQTTVAANVQPPVSVVYEKPIEKRWPIWIAFACLFALLLVGIGMLAAILIQQAGGVTVEFPDNQRLSVLANATPTPTVARREGESTPTIEASPTPNRVIIEPTASDQPDVIPPRVIPSPQTQPRYVISEVVNWSGWLEDGDARSWQLPSGTYSVEFTASGDGGTVEVSGSDCFKTRAMLSYRRQCEITYPGQIVVTNPTVFATGKPISVALRVVRLQKQ